jgi:RNA polymerase sigma factor (sigma-70 family)
MGNAVMSNNAVDNIGLAYSVVQRTGVPNGVSIQDTEEFSDACLGLINAERKYDPTKAKFSTFAYTVCYREVIRGKQKRYKKRQLGFGCIDEDLTKKLIDRNLFDPGVLKDHEKEKLLFVLLDCSDLKDRDLDIVKSYYCLGVQGVDLAKKYGLSKQRVSQILVETIIKIRKHNKILMRKYELLL